MSKSSSGLEVRILQETEFSQWRAFVDSAPAGSIYSYPEYLDVLCQVAGGSFRILGVSKGDEIQGGIALYEREAAGGRTLSGRLLLYYNGIVLRPFIGKYPSANASKAMRILKALEGALSSAGYVHTHLRNRYPISDLRVFLQAGWHARPSYSLEMQFGDMEQALSRVEQNQRRLIHRCETQGGTLTQDNDFDTFYQMHLGIHDRKGAPVYLPEEGFRRYFECLSSQKLCRLFHVRLPDGRAAASQLVLLGGHPVTHTVTAGADPDFLNTGVTPFLRWKTCEALAAEGYQANDLTDAALNEVTRFKSQLGGELVTNMVLSHSDSVRYRATRLASGTYRKGRSLIGRLGRFGAGSSAE